MGSVEDQKVLGTIAAAPHLAISDNTDAFFNAVPITELASIWCALQRLSRRDQTGSAWAAKLHFDHLPYKRPGRALNLALEVLRSETDKPTVMLLNDKLMPALIYEHGAAVIARLETDARTNKRLRWLLGGIYFGSDEPFSARVAAIGDAERWKCDEIARRTPKQRLDFEAMSLAELARAWIEQYSKSDRDRDNNFFDLMDYERDLREEDPDRALDLILEILKIETNPALLSLLAAGPLEDLVSVETIDRIEREARANRRFRDLLGGVWYYRATGELRARLDTLVGELRR